MENYIKIKPKIWMKTIASILTVIFIFQFFPAIVFGVQSYALQESDSVVENDKDNSLNSNTEIVGEIIEKRTLNEKHFLQEDGNIIATIYPSNIHYEENGQLLDIDNSLEESTEDEGLFKNKNNSFEVKFAKKSNNNNLVKLKIKGHNIKWSMQNSNKVNATKIDDNGQIEEKFKLKNISSGIIEYEDILEGIDLQYNVISNSIKENIILKDKTSIEEQIVFEFNTDNLKMEKTEDGRIIFSEEGKEEVLFFLEAPFMYDSKNEMSNDIEVKLEGKNNKYTLTLLPNREWLEDETREYPIIIDPTVETSLNYENIQDTYIFNGDSGYPNRYSAHILRVGSNNTLASKNPIRSLLKFTLPNLNSGDQVISATLDVCTYPDTSEWTPPSGAIQIDVHKMTQDWTDSTASWTNLSTKYDTRVSDYIKYQYDSNNPAKFYYFDITSIVKDWYVTGNNYGLVLKEHTETYNLARSDVYFYSADVNAAYINARPMVQIVYRNQTGLESYQTYHTQNVGRAGTIYTNDYNGNLTLLHHDFSTPGQNLSVSVNHVYNTNDKNVNIGYGNGYRLNISQTIEKVTIGSKEYVRYTDEDGTKHYFEKQGSSYIDSENLGLELTFENEKFTLKDKSNNKFIFDKKTNTAGQIWFLKQLVDSYNNITNIQLINDSTIGARVGSITDSAGDSISFSYNNNKLSQITDSASRTLKYEYDASGNLIKITYTDGKYSQYTYTNKLLTSVKNIDNYHMNYEYYNEKSNRVKSIKEYSIQNEIGSYLNITYGENVTKFTDNEGYTNTYTFNNFGQTISVSDFGKNPNDIDNAFGKMYEYGKAQNNKNKLVLESQMTSIKQMENNLVLNGCFDNGMNNWTGYLNESNDGVVNGSMKLTGNANLDKNIYQTCNVSGVKGDIYTYGLWVNTNGVPNDTNQGKVINVTIFVRKTSGTNQVISKEINADGTGWQFVSGEFITDADYQWIRIHILNNFNANETYIDNVGLFKEEFGQSYTYDEKGNIINTRDLAKNKSTFEYDSNNNLIASINPSGGEFTYEYDTTNPKKLISATNTLGNKYSFYYDNYGNVTSTKLGANDGTAKYIEASAEYSTNGNYQTKLVDELGNSTQYEYNQTKGTLTKVTDAKNSETTYEYDNLNRITKVSKQVNSKNYNNTYTYENDAIKTITHNGFSYSFIYDNFGNVKQTKVGNQTLATNTYEANNGNLKSITYGNSQQISYGYDRFDRLITEAKAQGTYQYTYDAKSSLKRMNSPEGIIKYYTYDLANRLVKVNDIYGFERNYKYDENNNTNSKKYVFNSISNETKYTFDDDNKINNIEIASGKTLTTNYDSLSRVNNKQIKVGTKTYTTQYTYKDLGNNKTTTSITSMKNGTNAAINYTYDALGNIETIKEGTTLKAKYYYDSLNQLIREDNAYLNKSITYEYDLGGNIINKKEYAYTTGTLGTATKTISYTYGNSNWKDQLTKYNGTNITYDNIGNPLSYGNNTYTWQNGRELYSITNSTSGLEVSYRYDENGIRRAKVLNGVVTRYHTEGDKVIYEKVDGSDNIIYYSYDENGNIIGLKYNDTQYYYIKNIQGDIIGILDNNLQQIVSYTYTSWGELISIKDSNGNEITSQTHIGIINPYRYRSYRYDTETGLYYLQSRYYNPEWGRFLNFDNYGGQVGELLSHNGYVYCKNNPVNMIDENGNWAMALPVVLSPLVQALVCTALFVTAAVVTTVVADSVVDYIENQEAKKNEKNHTVYKLRNDVNKEVDYVGRTVNPETREKNHKKTKPNHTFEIIASGLTREEARGIEQIYMIEYNTISLLNKINGISPNNLKKEIYMNAGRQVIQYLGNVVSNEALYWTGQ